MNDCIFCKIIAKEAPCDLIYEDDQVVVFRDIHPKAKVHLLIVTRQHIKSLMDSKPEHQMLFGHMLSLLPKLAEAQGLKSGFRTVINTGKGGGQEVDHIHFHLLGYGSLSAF